VPPETGVLRDGLSPTRPKRRLAAAAGRRRKADACCVADVEAKQEARPACGCHDRGGAMPPRPSADPVARRPERRPVALAALVGTFGRTPGQTVGVSSFIDPIASNLA